MAEKVLQIAVKVRDDGTLQVLDQAEKKMGRLGSVGGKAAGSITRAFTQAAGAIGTAFAAYRVADFLAESVTLANAQKEAFTKVEAVIAATGGAAGFSAGQVAELAAGLQAVTTYGDEAVLAAQSVLLTFKEIKGDAFSAATQAALDLSTVMGQDLKSSAVQLGKALNDPLQGISALQRVGVSFTQAQKDQIQVLAESGRLMEAQGIILAELESQFGGAAEAVAGTFGGALTQARHAWGDLRESLGAWVTESPALTGALQAVTEEIQSWGQDLQGIGPATARAVEVALLPLEVLGKALLAVGQAVNLLQGAFDLLAYAVVGSVDWVAAGVEKLYQVANLTGFFDREVAAIRGFRSDADLLLEGISDHFKEQGRDMSALGEQWNQLGAAMDRVRAKAREAAAAGTPQPPPVGTLNGAGPAGAGNAAAAVTGLAEAQAALAAAQTQAATLKTLSDAWQKAEADYAAHLAKLEALNQGHAERMRSIDDRVATLSLRLIDDPAQRAAAEMNQAFARVAQQKDLADALTGDEKVQALEKYIGMVEQAAHAWEAGGRELVSEKDAVSWAIEQIRAAQGELEGVHQTMAAAEREAADASAMWADSLAADVASVEAELEALRWQLEDLLARSNVDVTLDLVDHTSEGLARVKNLLAELAKGVTVPVSVEVRGDSLTLGGSDQAVPLVDGQFHAGGVVPREGTYLLDAGEIVVPPPLAMEVARYLAGAAPDVSEPAAALRSIGGQFHAGGVVPREGTDLLDAGEIVVPPPLAMEVARYLAGPAAPGPAGAMAASNGPFHAGGVVPRTPVFPPPAAVAPPSGAALSVTIRTGDIVVQGGGDPAETKRAVLQALEQADWQRLVRREVGPELDRLARRATA